MKGKTNLCSAMVVGKKQKGEFRKYSLNSKSFKLKNDFSQIKAIKHYTFAQCTLNLPMALSILQNNFQKFI